MKKRISAILVSMILLLLNTVVCPIVEADNSAPTLIYSCLDFEEQNGGDEPYGLYGASKSNFSVVSEPVDGNQNNKALCISSSSATKTYSQIPFYYAPIADRFVFGFRFKNGSGSSTKRIMAVTNATEPRNSLYLDTTNGSAFDLMAIQGSTLKISGKEYTLQNKWYELEFEINVSARTMNVYLDGNKYLSGAKLTSNTVANIASLRIYAPNNSGSWYLDDIKVYLGDKKLSAANFAAQKSLYENSEIIPEHKYELGRLYQYDKFVFVTLYNKFVARVNGTRYYKNNEYHNLQAAVTEDSDGVVSVPVRDFAEAFGGSFSSSGDTVTISSGGKSMQLSSGNNVFSQNGVVFAPLDTLADFFGISYYRNGDLLSFGEELICPFSLGVMGENGRGCTMEEEVFERIGNSLLYTRPTKEQVLSAYSQQNPQNAHPRLLITDFNKIINNRSRDSRYDGVVNSLITDKADLYINADPLEYTKSDGLRSTFAQPLCDRCTYLAFAYKITGDAKYKNALWSNIETVAAFPDFNPKHFLDVGICANGIKFAYDWLYNDWTAQQRQTLETIMLDKILAPGINAYRSPKAADETGFAYQIGNQPIIINCGIAGCALSLLDKYPDICSEVAACSLRSVETSLGEFAPDGAWTEGVSYWKDTMGSLPTLVEDYKTALGDDFGLIDTPGLYKSAYFPIGVVGGGAEPKTFPMGDDTGVSQYHASHMWFANVYNDKVLATKRRQNRDGASITDVVNWVFDEDLENPTFENDYYFRNMETVTMRTGRDTLDTVAILHGGQNNTNHGHLDAGTFQIDMAGKRWACEVPNENYNVLHYNSYTYDPTAPKSPYKPEDYYRFKAEGHNTVIANLGGTDYDQEPEAFAKMLKYVSTDEGSFAILDMTETNSLYQNAKRGLLLDKENDTVIVQDDFKASQETEFWWFMHVDPEAEIKLSDDKKTAFLTRLPRKVWVSIISDGDETFTVMDAAPMQGYYSVPTTQTANTGYKKLAVTKTTDNFKLSVAFKEIPRSATTPDVIPEYKAMEEWSFGDEGTIVTNEYDIKGISEGDRFAVSGISESKQKVYVVDKGASGITPSAATKLASADFYVDGNLVGNASSAPYYCDIPLTEGNHTLRVVANTKGVNSYDIGTYNYSVEKLSDTADSVIEDFDGGTEGTNVNFGTMNIAATESCTYKKAPGTDSMAMTFSYDGTHESGASNIFLKNIDVPESKILTFDYDFYSADSSGNMITHQMRNPGGSAVVPGYTFGSLAASSYTKDTWHHMSYVFDFESHTFRGYLDGYEIERGTLNDTASAHARFYLTRYSRGTLYVDNIKFCGKGEVVNIDATPYAVKGITDGERIPVGNKASSLSRTISVVDADAASRTITNATNLAKAEFFIDGVKKATVTSKPCQWSLPITDLRSHNLTIKTTDIAGGVQNFGPYAYSAVNMADGATSYTEYFEGTEGVGITKDKLPRISTFTTTENPVYAKVPGCDNTSMKLSMSSGKSTNMQSACDIFVPEQGITTYDFDFYCTSASEYYKIYFRTRNSGGFTMKNGDLTILENLSMKEVSNNTWHHVSYVFDSCRNEYFGAIDGYEFVRGEMDSRTPGRTVYFQLQTQSYTSGEFYLDNIEVMSKTETSEDNAGISAAGNNVTEHIINASGTKKKYYIYSADVVNNNKLSDVNITSVEVPAGTVWQNTEQVSPKTGHKIKMYIWNTVLKPVAKSPLMIE